MTATKNEAFKNASNLGTIVKIAIFNGIHFVEQNVQDWLFINENMGTLNDKFKKGVQVKFIFEDKTSIEFHF